MYIQRTSKAILLLLLLLLVGIVAPAREAQSAVLMRLGIAVVPNAVAPGGSIQIAGYGWPAQAAVRFTIASRDGTLILGSLAGTTADARGNVRTSLPIPSIPAGAYTVSASCTTCSPAITLDPIDLTVLAAPALSLRPAAGAPGTTVEVNVTNLAPGMLRLDYAGIPVLGPLAVRGTSYVGSFVVPSDRPTPFGATTTITAINLVSGNVVGQSAPMSFQTQPIPPPVQYRLTSVVAPVTPIKPGTPFTISGKIEPAPRAEALDTYSIKALWQPPDQPAYPLVLESISIGTDGAFHATATMPAVSKGAAAAALPGSMIDILAQERGQVIASSVIAAPDTGEKKLRVMVKDATSNTPIANAKVAIDVVATNMIYPDDLTKTTPFVDQGANWFLANQFQKMYDKSLHDQSCTVVAEPDIYESLLAPDQLTVIPDQTLAIAPKLNWKEMTPVALPGYGFARTQAAAQTLRAVTYRVFVDAKAQGYGNWFVDDQGRNVFTPTEVFLLWIPDTGKVYRLDVEDNTVAAADNPYIVSLNKLPPNITTGLDAELLIPDGPLLDADEQGQPIYGQFYSFEHFENDPSVALTVTRPISVTARVSTGTSDQPLLVRFLIDGQVFATFSTPPQGAAAQGAPQIAGCGSPTYHTPPDPRLVYRVEIPRSAYQSANDHEIKVVVADPADASDSATDRLKLRYVAPPDWFTNATGATSRSVKWSMGGPQLEAQLFDPNQRASIGKPVPYVQNAENNAVQVDSKVKQVLSPSGSMKAIAQAGNVPNVSLDKVGDAPQLTGALDSPGALQALSASPTGTIGPLTVVETPRIRVFDYPWGIPKVAFVNLSIDFQFRATMTIQHTIELMDSGGVRATIQPTLDARVTIYVELDAELLFGLGSASIWADPKMGALIPATFAVSADPPSMSIGDPCFYYGLKVYYKASAFWGLVKRHGSTTVFDGSNPKPCTPPAQFAQSLPNAGRELAHASPAIATDGQGHTLAVWRSATGNIVASGYDGVAWKPLTTISANGKSLDPAVAFFAPNQAVAVWSQSGLASPPADDAAPSDVFKAQHLAYAVWNGAAWSAPQNLTLPTTGDGRAALAGCVAGAAGCPAEGAVTAVWVHDAAGDITQRAFRLFSARYQGGAWSAAQPIDPASTASDMSPSVAYQNGVAVVAWVRDSDRNLNTLGNQRLALRTLDGTSPVVLPGAYPAGVIGPTIAAASNGGLLVAFTVADTQDGVLSNRRALYGGAGTCATAASCAWNVQAFKDSYSRPIFAETPVITLDADQQATLTYRAMGFDSSIPGGGPLANAALGNLAPNGELAQLAWNPDQAAVIAPHYLFDDGVMGWQPSAVYDPLTRSTIVLASQELIGGTGVLQSTTAAIADDQPVLVASTPQQPDFAIGPITPSARYPQPGQPLSVDVQLRNDGVAWPDAGGHALQVVATWDGPPGVGAPAGRATLSRLDAGRPVNLTLQLTPPPSLDQPHQLIVAVNPQQAIGEQRASNNQQSITIGGLPAPQISITATQRGRRLVGLQWEAVADARIAGYRVYRASTDGRNIPVGSTTASGFVDLSAALGQTYHYSVAAYTAAGVESAPSTSVVVTTSSYRVNLPMVNR